MKDTHEFQTIRVEVENALGRLTLNRPERLNAIGATMLQEVAEAARWFDTHRELRVVIVSGAGRAFCAGADLKDSPAAAASRLEIAITKEHVNAITRSMCAGMTAFADGDLLLGASGEEESRAAARSYREKAFRKS